MASLIVVRLADGDTEVRYPKRSVIEPATTVGPAGDLTVSFEDDRLQRRRTTWAPGAWQAMEVS